MNSFVVETIINAPTNLAWQALADIGNIYAWNLGVRASHTTSDVQEGGSTGIYGIDKLLMRKT